MKAKINKAAFEALSPELQGEYKPTDDADVYALTVEGADDLTAIQKKKEIAEQHRKQAEKKAKDLEAELEALREETAKNAAEDANKRGDTDALNKSWEAKLAKKDEDFQRQLKQRDEALHSLLVDNTAERMANEIAISGSAELLVPHIKNRLRVEYVDGKPQTKVVDEAGNSSASTLQELQEEFRAKPAFAPIIVGSKANGGGANGGKGGGGTSKKLSEMTATEEARFANEHPEEYKRLLGNR